MILYIKVHDNLRPQQTTLFLESEDDILSKILEPPSFMYKVEVSFLKKWCHIIQESSAFITYIRHFVMA